MAVTFDTHAPQGTSIAARLSVFFAELAEAQEKRALYRRTLSELKALSGRELADIGLNRGNIRSAAYEVAYGN